MTRLAQGTLLLLLAATGSLSWGAEISVPGHHGTIQEAVDAAADGDLIEVAAGRYQENLVIDSKSITLVSTDGPEATILDGLGAGRVVSIYNGSVTLDGFTVKYGQASEGGGVYFYADHGSPTVRLVGNVIVDNNLLTPGSHGGGVAVVAEGMAAVSLTLAGNQITRNKAANGGGLAFNTDQEASLTVESSGNTINLNEAGGGAGVHLNPVGVDASITFISKGDAFLQNAAYDTCTQGGALYSYNHDAKLILNLEDSVILENGCYFGGGLYLLSSTSGLSTSNYRVKNSLIKSNKFQGILIYDWGKFNLNLDQVEVFDNTHYGDAAGSLFFELRGPNSEVSMNRIQVDNFGYYNSGGLKIRNHGDLSLNIANSTLKGSVGFASRCTDYCPLGLYITNHGTLNGTLINSVVDGNMTSSDDGSASTLRLDNEGSADFAIVNASIFRSASSAGPDVGVYASSTIGEATLRLTNTLVHGPDGIDLMNASNSTELFVSHSFFNEAFGVYTDLGGNVSGLPLLDGTMPMPGSPLIDTADGDLAPPTDRLGNPRVDDADTANTGRGEIAYADIGAHEYLPRHFSDVPSTHWAYSFVENLFASAITGGCGGGNFCPEATVTRAQMAVFLEKAMRGGAFRPPPAVGGFGDVPPAHWAAGWIEQFARDGITGGCGGGNFCPDRSVTRAQMAVFLEKAMAWPGPFSPAPGTGTMFADVPPGHWACAWVEQLATDGITGGCTTTNYCPESPVTRAQMAVFLVKAFGL